jgi:hypothetical protein
LISNALLNDLVFSLHGMQFFTTLDLVRGYYQILLEESTKQFTAFSTICSHYQFKRLSFRLKNAPAAFQRKMQEILKGYLGKQVVVYIIDILIMSCMFEEHLDLVGQVLGTLKAFGVTIKLSVFGFVAQCCFWVMLLGVMTCRKLLRMLNACPSSLSRRLTSAETVPWAS